MTATYTIASTSLGPALIATTERGVCRLTFGQKVPNLVAVLDRDRGDALVRRDDGALAPLVDAVRRYLAGETPTLDLRTDATGSPFEGRVWAALRAIPAGETCSYGAVARLVGGGATPQEVAAACAANPIALVVPCHRVIRSDGTLGGYRWGAWRKRALLAIEARAAALPGAA